jgi:hypothetical protein
MVSVYDADIVAMPNKGDIDKTSDDYTAETSPSSNEEVSAGDRVPVGRTFRDKVTEKWIRKLQNRKYRKQSSRAQHRRVMTYRNVEVEWFNEVANHSSDAPTQNRSRLKIRSESWTNVVQESNLKDMTAGKECSTTNC